MPEATESRTSAPLTFVFLAAVLIANTIVFAQAGQGGAGGQRGAGAPAGAPAPGAQAPAAGPAAAAPAQGRGGAPAAAPGARGAAPVDLTGTWVSIVTEDWIERMSPDSPPSGVPRGGRGGGGGGGGGRGGGAPAVAPTPGSEQCRVYAAGGSMRVPGRLNISWSDDNTLKVDMDAGTQTRLFRFNTTVPPNTPKSLQGYSIATWELGGGGGRGGGGRGGGGGGAAPPRWGSLRVVTTNLSGGYLLSSRNAYSENATLTEHFTRHSDFGQEYFTVTALVDDPTPPGGGGGGRGGPYSMTSSTFKKEPNNSKFAPTGCEIVR